MWHLPDKPSTTESKTKRPKSFEDSFESVSRKHHNANIARRRQRITAAEKRLHPKGANLTGRQAWEV